MTKPKLSLHKTSIAEALAIIRAALDRVGENATVFVSPNPPLAGMLSQVQLIEGLLASRRAQQEQLQALTLQIHEKMDTLKFDVSVLVNYVHSIAKGNASIHALAGMGSSEGYSPVGEMPKIEELSASHGDNPGEIDLQWNPVSRGLKTYQIEVSEAVNGADGWRIYCNEGISKCTLTGLVPGKRYWIRVRAVGAEGPGVPSDPVTRTATAEA